MSSDEPIHNANYTQGKPIVKAIILLINPDDMRQEAIEADLWIDTGFDGGLHIASFHMASATLIGLNLFPGNIGVAGGKTDVAYRCLAYLQKIGDKYFPAPGLEAELIFHGGDRHGLLGLDILKNWILTFNGPNEVFEIKKPMV
jgi:hypothetical protein